MTPADYVKRIDAELRGNILPFWIRHTVDRERGGFFGEISRDLVVKKDAERGALLSSRILWTYSAAYRRFPQPEYLEMANWAFQDLMARFWDEEHGGLFWSASAEGRPQRDHKQVYGQAFGIYALTEYYTASREQLALQRAQEIYELLERHAHDKENGGYFEAFTREWGLKEDVRLSSIDLNEPKSQNTHLHVMEAYTNLLRVQGSPEVRAVQTDLVEVMISRILDERTYHLGLFFDTQFHPRSDRISFGHDIEAAWLLHEAAKVIDDEGLLSRVRNVALSIARVTYAEGLDADGSLLYEAGPTGVTDSTKEWWPQAEAAVGFLDAYQIGGDNNHLQAALRLWDFIEANLVDREKGEWYRAVARDGTKDTQAPKVSFWKCPYHNGRACLELIDRLDTLP